MTQPWFTNDQELDHLWRQLSQTYQLMNSTDSKAEATYLANLAEMLRLEYRSLTSRFS